MEKEDLRKHLLELRKQISETQKLLDSFEYEERISEAKKYIGRCFEEKNNHPNREYIRCLFVYGFDKESAENNSLLVSYWKEYESSYFTLEHYGHFNPKNWENEDEWQEITKEKFMEHYEQVQKRISMSITTS